MTENTARSSLLVESRGLTKRYGGGITTVDDLDLTVRPGEVYDFLGWLISAVWMAMGALLATLFRGTPLAIGLLGWYTQFFSKGVDIQSDPVKPERAVLTLGIYVVFLLVSALLLRRRDIT